jgi:glutathione S-transferase
MSRSLYVVRDTPASRIARVLLIEKNLPFETLPVDPAHPSESLRARSPQGALPVLVDGAAHVVEVLPIAEYLEDTYPAPPMLGTGFDQRLRHRTFALLALELLAADDAESSSDAAVRTHGAKAFTLALDALEHNVSTGRAPDVFGLGHAAVACAFRALAESHGRDRTVPARATELWLTGFGGRESLSAASTDSVTEVG